MNDRQLRHIVDGLQARSTVFHVKTVFDITVVSEVKASSRLSENITDPQEPFEKSSLATAEGKPVTAKDLKAGGAMAAVLKDAIHPNLVQTLGTHTSLDSRRTFRQYCLWL